MKKKQATLIFVVLTALSILMIVFRKPFMIHIIMKGGTTSGVIGILLKWLGIFGALFFIAAIVSLIYSWRKKSDVSMDSVYRSRMLRFSLFRQVPFFGAVVVFSYLCLMPNAFKYGDCVFYAEEFPQKIYGDFGTVKYECSRDEYLVGAYDVNKREEKILVVSEIHKGFQDGLDIIIFDKQGVLEARYRDYTFASDPNWKEELLNSFAEKEEYTNLFPLSGLRFID